VPEVKNEEKDDGCRAAGEGPSFNPLLALFFLHTVSHTAVFYLYFCGHSTLFLLLSLLLL